MPKKRRVSYTSLTLTVDATGAATVADLAADMRRVTTPTAARALRGEYILWLIEQLSITTTVEQEPAFETATTTMEKLVPGLPEAQRMLWTTVLASS